MSSTIYVAAPLMLLLAIMQTAILPLIPALILVPQVPLLVVLSWGLVRGVNEGVLWAFVAGIFLDLFSAGPVGLTPLTFMIAILVVSWIGRVLPKNQLLLPIVLSGLATIIWQLLYLLLLSLVGYPITSAAVAQLPRIAALHAVLILPIYWLMLGVLKLIWPRPVTI